MRQTPARIVEIGEVREDRHRELDVALQRLNPLAPEPKTKRCGSVVAAHVALHFVSRCPGTRLGVPEHLRGHGTEAATRSSLTA